MSIEYYLDKELQKMIDDQIANFRHFKAIKENNVIVVSVMKSNLAKDGEAKPCKGLPVTTKRVGPVERCFMEDGGPHFIIVMDYTTWNESNDEQRSFWVHHGLKGIHAEKDKENAVVVSKTKPEIVVYVDTVETFGPVFESLLLLGEATGRKVLKAVSNMAQEAEAPPEPEAEVVEPEPDVPPPRRAQKVRITSE